MTNIVDNLLIEAQDLVNVVGSNNRPINASEIGIAVKRGEIEAVNKPGLGNTKPLQSTVGKRRSAFFHALLSFVIILNKSPELLSPELLM